MKFHTEILKAIDLYDMRIRLTPAIYQRGQVWTLEKQKLLIDSIQRGIDIPKLYFFEYNGGKSFEIVDGNQRFATLVAFFEDEFKTLDGYKYSQLPPNERRQIKDHPFTIVFITEASEDDLSQLFLRLQLGVPTNVGEKLNAILGPMRDFVNDLAKSDFMRKISVPKRRFAKETVCAQICLNALRPFTSRGFQDTKYEDLRDLYEREADFDRNSSRAQRIRSTFVELNRIFGDDATKIRNRASVVSAYFLVAELMYRDVLDREKVKSFYMEFLLELDKQVDLGLDATNRTLVGYYNRIWAGADSGRAIAFRHETLLRLYEYYVETGRIGK